MEKGSRRFRCPLCGSLLGKTRYYEIIGVWEERKRFEMALQEELRNLRKERQKLVQEKNQIRAEMERQMRKAVKEALERGKAKEKARADRLSRMIQAKTQDIQNLNRKIKELQEQLKKGTTPQTEGLNFEEHLFKELGKEFPDDRIERHGKNGDIIHRVNFRSKCVGVILYECKKTTKFSSSFIDQTKRAMATRQATYGVLVTTASKKNTAGFWVEKDVLVVHPYGAVYVAKVLRRSIIEIHSLKVSKTEMEKRSKYLMDYIRSEDFKNSVNDSIYRTRCLYEMLKKEIRTHQASWQDRYTHYRTIHDNISRLELVTSNILKGLPPKEAIDHLRLKQLPPPSEAT